MTTATKERPILFSGPMVKAILDGRKTQTRRIVKPQPRQQPDGAWFWQSKRYDNGLGTDYFCTKYFDGIMDAWAAACPYGAPGERLWVRETWTFKNWSMAECRKVGCPDAATHPTEEMWGEKTRAVYRASFRNDIAGVGKWRPSIHMPRWASRITLEVTDVRVERLNDISEEDAIAEGSPRSHPSIDAVSRSYGFPDFARSYFGQLWESINGEGSWADNPWVWVVEFKRLEPKQ